MKSEFVSRGFSKRGLGALGAVVAIAALAPAGAQAAGLTVPQASQAAPVTVPHVEAPPPTPATGPSADVPTSESVPGEPMGDDVLDSGNYGAGPSTKPPAASESDASGVLAVLFIFNPVAAVVLATAGTPSSPPPAEAQPIRSGTLTDPSCPDFSWEFVNNLIEDGGGADGCN